MIIGGLQKITLIDYPGKIAATIFVSGCNFRCPWCYNRELVLPDEIIKHPSIPLKKIYEFLEERKGFLEALVICGGEPTIHQELPDLIKKIKKFGYLVKLDTNGSGPKMLKKLIEEKLIDYVAMDIKALFRKAGSDPALPYEKATGVKIDLNNIKKSIEIIKSSGLDYEFRTTVVPTIHTKEDIIKIAKWLSPAKKYFLQNFQPRGKMINPSFSKLRPYPEEELKEIQKEIAPYFDICKIR